MKQPKQPNRWVILAAAALCGLMNGVVYVWSIFRNPLMEAHGWGASEVTLAYSLFALLCLVGAFIGGPLQRAVRPSILVMCAGLLQGAGFVATGFANSLPMLYLAYSLLAGIGNGVIYGAAVSTATKWFPDKKGLANGICIGCMGLSPIVFAPLGNFFINSFDVSTAFIGIGVVNVVVFVTVPWLIKAPEPGWTPEGWDPEKAKETGTFVASRNFRVGEMLKTPLFWLLWVVFVCAITAGSMMAGQASAIGQAMAPISASEGSLLVAILAVASFSGRFLLGALSDRIGRFPTLCIAMVVSAVDLLAFMGGAHTFVSFMVAMFVVGFCYGGIMSNLPGVCSDVFGQGNFGVNYPFLYSAYTAATFIGPMVASSVLESTGVYDQAFVIAGVLGVIGAVLVLAARSMAKRLQA